MNAPTIATPVRTSRFGDFTVPEDRLLTFPLGLVGFPDATTFVLVEHRPGSRFRWFQSTQYAELAFLVIDPTLVAPDFPTERVRPALAFCDLEQDEDIAVLAICCVPSATPATVNLMAPLGIGLRSRRGAQIIVHETGYTTDMPLLLDTRAQRHEASA